MKENRKSKSIGLYTGMIRVWHSVEAQGEWVWRVNANGPAKVFLLRFSFYFLIRRLSPGYLPSIVPENVLHADLQEDLCGSSGNGPILMANELSARAPLYAPVR